MASKVSEKYDCVLKAMAYSFHFKATDDNGNRYQTDILFDKYISYGVEFTLQRICGLNHIKDSRLIDHFASYYEETTK